MTTKTVKQIVDEFKNRNQRTNVWYIMFVQNGSKDGYSMVTNIYRDGVKIESPELDEINHKYEFDSGFRQSFHVSDIEWTHREFIGKIVEIGQKIEE